MLILFSLKNWTVLWVARFGLDFFSSLTEFWMGSFWLLYLSPWMCRLFSVSEIWQSVNCQPRRDSVQGDPDMSPVGDQDGGCSQWRGLLGCKLQSCVVFFTCVLFVAGMFVCLVMCHERKRVCVCVCVCVCVSVCMHACLQNQMLC